MATDDAPTYDNIAKPIKDSDDEWSHSLNEENNAIATRGENNTDIELGDDDVDDHDDDATPIPITISHRLSARDKYMRMRSDSKRYVSTSKSFLANGSCKAICILFIICLFICAWFGGFSYMIYYGTDINAGAEIYAQTATQETCSIQSYDATECRWKCQYNLSSGKYESCHNNCQSCTGTAYTYTVTVEHKCYEQEISNTDILQNNQCPEALKEVGTEHSCFVLECDEFSWESPQQLKTAGTMYIVVGCLLLAAPFCCFFCFYFCCKD